MSEHSDDGFEHILVEYALRARSARAELEALADKLAGKDPTLRRALDTIEKWLWC